MENPELKTLLDTLEEVNKIIEKLDPAIREKAFDLVAGHLGAAPVQPGASVAPSSGAAPAPFNSAPPGDTSSSAAFFSGFDHSKPAENVSLIAAWLFSQHGVFPISTTEIKSTADSVGITVPSRIDMTLKGMKKNKKTLFQKVGKNFQLTVSGELYLKETYGIAKGTTPRPSE